MQRTKSTTIREWKDERRKDLESIMKFVEEQPVINIEDWKY